MLAAIGVDSIDELFEQIPEPLRLGRAARAARRAERGRGLRAPRRARGRATPTPRSEVCFVGAGMYDHYVPAIVDAITQRSEFLTPYTPYQPEISQGGLQAMFEFQTAMSELTGLPVSNAGLYEGPSSVASAGYLAMGATGRRRFVVSRGVHPHSRETLATYSVGYGAEVEEVGLEDGVTDAAALAAAVDGETAAVFLQSPNFLGAVEDVEALGAAAKEHGALLVVAVDPMTLGILRPPGECGADIALGEGQPLGNRLDFGGPSFGFFCAHRGADPPHARPDRRRNRRRRRPPRLRPRPADPRAAHPPREGDQQHLHGPGAERAGGDGPPRLARPPGLPRAGRAAGAPHRLRPRAARRGRGRRAAARGAGRARVRRLASAARRSTASSSAAPSAGSPPATRSAASTPSTRTACWSRSPSAAPAPRSTSSPRPSAPPIAAERGGFPTREVGISRRRRSCDGALETPMQRERAETIYEKSKPGRRAAVLPDAEVPERAARGADPGRSCCARSRPACRRSPSRRSSATTTASRAATSTSTPASTRSAPAR